MKDLLRHIEQRTAEFARRPLFSYLADEAVPQEKRLALVPCMAHFVFSFMDINRFVLPSLPATQEYQRLVNIHAAEDACHWPWYLHDLQLLQMDRSMLFSQALRFLWGDATRHSRRLTYRCVAMIAAASPIQKLALVETIEMTGKVFLEHTASLCNAWLAGPGELAYYGQNHAACETGHHMGTEGVADYLRHIELAPADRAECAAIVDELFGLYGDFVDEMLVFAQTMNASSAGEFAAIGALAEGYGGVSGAPSGQD